MLQEALADLRRMCEPVSICHLHALLLKLYINVKSPGSSPPRPGCTKKREKPCFECPEVCRDECTDEKGITVKYAPRLCSRPASRPASASASLSASTSSPASASLSAAQDCKNRVLYDVCWHVCGPGCSTNSECRGSWTEMPKHICGL